MEGTKLLKPLEYYEKEGKTNHARNVEEYFDNLVKKSGVDIPLNKKNVKAYNKQCNLVEHLNSKIKKFRTIRGFMIFFTIVSFICAVVGIALAVGSEEKINPLAIGLTISLGLIIGIALILIICLKINKIIKHYVNSYNDERAKADNLLNVCKAQLSPLNSLFSERDTFNIIEKTLPEIKFNDNFDFVLAEDFKKNYDFIDLMNENRSVVDTVSGRLFKNPFVFYRYVNHYMGSKNYEGSLVIHWTTTSTDSEGHVQTEHHTQTLYAHVNKPFPCYNYGTGLNYGHQSAPDLNFSREYSHVENLNDKQIERKIKSGEKHLQKQAENATEKGGNFTEMANSEFDVLFGANDRDHEVQFRMLFSPLAQINMVDLLRSKTGYGDDFLFTKRGRFNFIESEHSQHWNMDTSPANYYSYDIDIIKEKFCTFNNEYFRSVFFDLAPLLSIPSYQEEPNKIFEPIRRGMGNYAYYEHEALANSMGVNNFMHPDTATDVILKAKYLSSENDTDNVQIDAFSYSENRRVDYVSVLGGDGHFHSVPVYWSEYLPVEKSTNIIVKNLGLTNSEFNEKVEKSDLKESIFSAPHSFLHGLFARITDGEDIKSVDNILNKLK